MQAIPSVCGGGQLQCKLFLVCVWGGAATVQAIPSVCVWGKLQCKLFLVCVGGGQLQCKLFLVCVCVCGGGGGGQLQCKLFLVCVGGAATVQAIPSVCGGGSYSASYS